MASASASLPTFAVNASASAKSAAGKTRRRRDPVDLEQLPVGNLRSQLGDLLVCHGRSVAPARDAPLLRQRSIAS